MAVSQSPCAFHIDKKSQNSISRDLDRAFALNRKVKNCILERVDCFSAETPPAGSDWLLDNPSWVCESLLQPMASPCTLAFVSELLREVSQRAFLHMQDLTVPIASARRCQLLLATWVIRSRGDELLGLVPAGSQIADAISMLSYSMDQKWSKFKGVRSSEAADHLIPILQSLVPLAGNLLTLQRSNRNLKSWRSIQELWMKKIERLCRGILKQRKYISHGEIHIVDIVINLIIIRDVFLQPYRPGLRSEHDWVYIKKSPGLSEVLMRELSGLAKNSACLRV